MKLRNIKLVIFDVDGVLIDSKNNMRLSFQKLCRDNNLNNIRFEDYFKNIGTSFENMMNKLGIKKNIPTLKKQYFLNSIKFKKQIKPYKNVYDTLIKLKDFFLLAVVTSKRKKNAQNFMNFFFPKVKFKIICSPNSKLRAKPYPDTLMHVINKLKINRKNAVYVGDTFFDYLAAKRTKINFILAEYGYITKKKRIRTNYKIKIFSDLIKLLK